MKDPMIQSTLMQMQNGRFKMAQVNNHTELSAWAVDEWTYHLFLDPQVARQRLEHHWQTFITR